MKYKTFDDYLRTIHAESYTGTDDYIPEAFESWLEQFDVADILELVEKYEKEKTNMKTLTEKFEEIIDDVQTKYQVESTVVFRLIEAVKERDQKVLGEYEKISDENVEWSNKNRIVNKTKIEIHERMEETL